MIEVVEVINRTIELEQTDLSFTLLKIMATCERFDKYAVDAYVPEMGFHYDNQEWSVFKAVNVESDRNGYLCYSSEDDLSFLSVRTLRRRVRLSRLKENSI